MNATENDSNDLPVSRCPNKSERGNFIKKTIDLTHVQMGRDGGI
jgi:hypothetical protein